jgi:hypothetical protein
MQEPQRRRAATRAAATGRGAYGLLFGGLLLPRRHPARHRSPVVRRRGTTASRTSSAPLSQPRWAGATRRRRWRSGRPGTLDDPLTADHVIRRADGRPNVRWNYRAVHQMCNTAGNHTSSRSMVLLPNADVIPTAAQTTIHVGACLGPRRAAWCSRFDDPPRRRPVAAAEGLAAEDLDPHRRYRSFRLRRLARARRVRRRERSIASPQRLLRILTRPRSCRPAFPQRSRDRGRAEILSPLSTPQFFGSRRLTAGPGFRERNAHA